MTAVGIGSHTWLSREKLYHLPSGHEVAGVRRNIVGTVALRERSVRRGGHGLMLALLVLGGRNMADPWRNLAMALDWERPRGEAVEGHSQ